jgi:hypothetical protein
MSVLPYPISVRNLPQVAPRFANGGNLKGLLRHVDLRHLVRILNRASQNLLDLSRRKPEKGMTSASFLARQRKRTKNLSRNGRKQGDAMKTILSETYAH